MLPSAHEAAAWFVDTARASLDAGGSLDLDAVLVLRTLAPDDPVVARAVERLPAGGEGPAAGELAARARYTAAALVMAAESRDEERARAVVDDFETDLLGALRPGRSLGTFEADVAVASVLLDCWELGHQLPHAMMAEELMLIIRRVYWPERDRLPFPALAEAARSLLRLHRSPQAKPEYYDNGVALLHDLAATYRQHGLAAAPYVLALRLIS